MTNICVSKPTTIGSDNGLSPGRRQAIIWTNAGILLIGPLGTNLSEILNEIHTFSLKKMHLKMSFGKWRPFCLDLNVLIKITLWQNSAISSIKKIEVKIVIWTFCLQNKKLNFCIQMQKLMSNLWSMSNKFWFKCVQWKDHATPGSTKTAVFLKS